MSRPSTHTLVLGRKGKNPGTWVLSSTTPAPINDINGNRSDRQFKVESVEKVTVEYSEHTKYSTVNIVFYKERHLSKESKGFNAELAPKWEDQ